MSRDLSARDSNGNNRHNNNGDDDDDDGSCQEFVQK